MDIKIRRRLGMLHALLGSSHAGERENAWAKIIEILCEQGCSWNDLPDLLRATGETESRDATREPSGRLPLERLGTALGEYLQLQEHEYLAVALWIAHTFVFNRFMMSPRLALASPVRRCGKTSEWRGKAIAAGNLGRLANTSLGNRDGARGPDQLCRYRDGERAGLRV